VTLYMTKGILDSMASNDPGIYDRVECVTVPWTTEKLWVEKKEDEDEDERSLDGTDLTQRASGGES